MSVADQEPVIMKSKSDKPENELRAKLTPEQYRITREKGTEPAFTGKYWDCHDKGMYQCVCCGAELFDSSTKFDSGSGWPSFWAPANSENIGTEEDHSFAM